MAGPADARPGSTLTLLSEAISGIGRLVKGELYLARVEATEGLKAAGSGLVKLALAAVMALVGLNVLASAAVAALAEVGLKPALAALLVGLALCLLALGLAAAGRAALRLRGLWPGRGLHGLWRDGQALKAGMQAKSTEAGGRDGNDA